MAAKAVIHLTIGQDMKRRGFLVMERAVTPILPALSLKTDTFPYNIDNIHFRPDFFNNFVRIVHVRMPLLIKSSQLHYTS